MKFTKMQAFGNDYVYVDAIHQTIENPNELSIKMSNRHFGIGADGLVMICPSERCDFRMRIFNPDGTEAEMCGNAVRSVGKFVYYHGLTDKTTVTIETLGGEKTIL
ncbi:MAG: diaminopimelate epimerase, partial [Lachnospiraceae bacterium]|nr:diaminopimelate epimerase [Lachnospiraceae bacterium]